MAVFLPDELDCQYCTDQQKEIRGCEKESSTGYVLNTGEIVYRCPVTMITRDTANYLSLYNNCEKFNSLPFDGGIGVQPAKIFTVFGKIQNLIDEKTKDRMEKIRHGKNNIKY